MITQWSQGAADDHMAEAILVDQAGRIRKHPWWQARAKLTLRLLERLDIKPPAWVIDVGCGWGVTLAALERSGYKTTGLDISKQTLEMLNREKPERNLIEADLTASWPADFTPFDAVLALDVIEHLDDDHAAIGRLVELVKPGGVLIVSVPALPDLFSEFDEIQGHRRRYLPEMLETALTYPQLTYDVFWWGSWMVPLVRRQRRRSVPTAVDESASQIYQRYLKLPPWPAPLVMSLLFAREETAALEGRLKVGTSLFAVVRRDV